MSSSKGDVVLILFFLTLLSMEVHADELCAMPERVAGNSRHNYRVECGDAEGFVDGSTVPRTITLTDSRNNQVYFSNPSCDGTPCTLEMLRNPQQYASLRGRLPAGFQGEASVLVMNLAANVPLYLAADSGSTTYTIGSPFSVKRPMMDVRTREITYVDSRPDDPALARRPEPRLTPAAPAVPTPEPRGGVVLSTEVEEPAAPLATNCKYRDRVVDGKDAAPSIVNIPGCSEKVCLAEARCDVGGRRRLVSVYCPAIGTENCPDATACANSEEFGTTVEALEVRELAPGARIQRAGER